MQKQIYMLHMLTWITRSWHYLSIDTTAFITPSPHVWVDEWLWIHPWPSHICTHSYIQAHPYCLLSRTHWLHSLKCENVNEYVFVISKSRMYLYLFARTSTVENSESACRPNWTRSGQHTMAIIFLKHSISTMWLRLCVKPKALSNIFPSVGRDIYAARKKKDTSIS